MDEEEPFPEGEKYLTDLEQKIIKELKEICKQKGLSQRGSNRCLISVVYAAWVFDVKDKLTAEERRHTVLLERSEKLEVSGGVSDSLTRTVYLRQNCFGRSKASHCCRKTQTLLKSFITSRGKFRREIKRQQRRMMMW